MKSDGFLPGVVFTIVASIIIGALVLGPIYESCSPPVQNVKVTLPDGTIMEFNKVILYVSMRKFIQIKSTKGQPTQLTEIKEWKKLEITDEPEVK